jgi:hypothetical protein
LGRPYHRRALHGQRAAQRETTMTLQTPIDTAPAQPVAPAPTPAEAVLQIVGGFWLSRALWGAAKLKLADAIGATPMSADAIALASGGQADAVRRVLTALAAFGFFVRMPDGRFAHNAMSEVLRSDHPESQRSFIEAVYGNEHYGAWAELETTMRTGKPGFDVHYGKPVFDYFREHPQSEKVFGEAMTATTRMVDTAVLAAHDFGRFELAVDIGGSHASLLCGILARHPESRGIVFDLPATMETGRAVWSQRPEGTRISGVGGDFFEKVPEGDLYLLKFILHDWTDAQCGQILRTVRAAARPGARLAIVEMVLPESPAPHPGFLMDLNMLAQTGGRERTVADYDALLRPAGFRIARVTPTASPMSVIEAEAV